MENKMSGVKKASVIGTITVISYVANYFLRNMLGVLTPFMLKNDFYTKEYVALLSSVYMIAYAAGQLFNGVLGDIFKPRIMVLLGLLIAGAVNISFPLLQTREIQLFLFFILGYALSMLRGPLMKIISENTAPNHARIICVFFSFAGFAGPLISSIISMFFNWQMSFVFAGLLTFAIAFGTYTSLSALEKKNALSFKRVKSSGFAGITEVFKIEKFTFYIIIACLVEIAGASISFWIPTLLTEYASFSETKSNLVFSFISLVRAIMPFLALTIFNLSGERDILIMKFAYAISFVAFIVMLFVPAGLPTVIFLLIALAMSSLVSSLLWSIYIPGLGKTGRVSSVNGIIDCTGYIAASASTSLFAQIVVHFGWNGLIIAWSMIPLIGIIASIIYSDKKVKV